MSLLAINSRVAMGVARERSNGLKESPGVAFANQLAVGSTSLAASS